MPNSELAKKLETILRKIEFIEAIIDQQEGEIQELRTSHKALYEELYKKKKEIDDLKDSKVGSK